MLKKKQAEQDVTISEYAATEKNATVIGENTNLKGTIRSKDEIRILGKFEGSINGDSFVTVEKQAKVKANVSGREVAIHGTVIGNIVASEKIFLSSSAKLEGNIKSPRMVMTPGAIFQGKVAMD